MQFMLIVSGPESFAECGPPPAELMEQIEKSIGDGMADGSLVSFGGFHPTSTGARIRISNGEAILTDGPFTESKEVIGGFSIINVASKGEAMAKARAHVEMHRKYWPRWQGVIEVRQMYVADDDVRELQIEGSRERDAATADTSAASQARR